MCFEVKAVFWRKFIPINIYISRSKFKDSSIPFNELERERIDKNKINDIENRKQWKKSIKLNIGCVKKVIRKTLNIANKINYKLLIWMKSKQYFIFYRYYKDIKGTFINIKNYLEILDKMDKYFEASWNWQKTYNSISKKICGF